MHREIPNCNFFYSLYNIYVHKSERLVKVLSDIYAEAHTVFQIGLNFSQLLIQVCWHTPLFDALVSSE